MSRKLNDLTGKTFGLLTVINRAENDINSKSMWCCKCDCGNEKIISGNSLSRGNSTSCGCFKLKLHTTHGMSKSNIYKVFTGMLQRCNNKKHKNYKDYGARGISVCKDWLTFESFYKWSMENGYRENITLDRVDNNGNYSPSNCKWVTMAQQSLNKRSSFYITFNGKTQTLKEWCNELNIPYPQIYTRIAVKGWTCERAFLTKFKYKSPSKNKKVVV